MSKIDFVLEKVAIIFSELEKKTSNEICEKYNLGHNQFKSVIENHLNNSNKYTKNNLARYLAIPRSTVKYWFEDKTFPKEVIELKDQKLEVIELGEFWSWMAVNKKTFNYAKIKPETIEKAGNKIIALYKKSFKTLNHKENWTKVEEDLLEELWGIEKMSVLCKMLGRTKEAVLTKRSKMGLMSSKECWGDITCGTLSKVLGYKIDVINRWEEKYDFPVRRRKPTNNKKDIRFVDVEKFWLWAEKHKGVVNLTKCQLDELMPVPSWAYGEKLKQTAEKEKMDYFKRDWSQNEILKLIYFREIKKTGFPTLAKMLVRKTYMVERKYKELKGSSDFEGLLEKVGEADFSGLRVDVEPRTQEFDEGMELRILHLTTLPKFNWGFASNVLGVPRTTLRRRYGKLQKEPNFEKLMEKAKNEVFEEYENVFEELDRQSRANKDKRWSEEALNRLIYLLEVERMSKEEASKILNRSYNAVDYQHRMAKKKPGFEELVKKMSSPQNRFLDVASKVIIN